MTEDSYLGDVISPDMKNEKNIKKRISKGLGIISEIMHMLSSISMGSHYFSIAMLLRESLFLNGILTNAEIWYKLTKKDLQELSDLDKSLLRRILKTPITVTTEAMYLELGCLDIETIIKARRINYLFYLVNCDESEMLHKFFITQWKYGKSGDWTEQVRMDLQDFGLCPNLDSIKSTSKHAFKRMVKCKAKKYALQSFLQKKENHSKLKDLYYSDLKMQNYFLSDDLTVEQSQHVFSFRTRMAKFSENFRSQSGPATCPLCFCHLDNQPMSCQCKTIRGKYFH